MSDLVVAHDSAADAKRQSAAPATAPPARAGYHWDQRATMSVGQAAQEIWRRVKSIRGTVLLTALAYLLFTLIALCLHGGDPLWFAWLDTRSMRGDPAGSIGYDGQFVYAIAVEGLEAARLLHNPPYRFQRILLPLLVRLLAAGQPRAVAWLIPLVNGAAIVGGGYLLARRLARNRFAPLYAWCTRGMWAR